MVYRRSRRSPLRKKRMLRRRKNVRTAARSQKVHFFKRVVYLPAYINTIPLSDTTFVLNPQLNDLPDAGEFTKLFDQYCIKGVTASIIPRFNVSQSQPVGTVPPPPSQVFTAMDYDGSIVSNMAEIQQYQNLKMTKGTSIHTRFFKPAIQAINYRSTTSVGYVPKWNQFISSAQPDIPHYSLVGVIPACGMTFAYDLKATYYIACKNVK